MKVIISFVVLVYMACTPLAFADPVSPKGCLEADIIFVLDTSSSVQGFETFIANALETFVEGVVLSPEGIKVGCVSFASVVNMSQRLTSDKEPLYTIVDSLRINKASGGTSMAPALTQANTYFLESLHERGKEVLKVIICISDGELGDMGDSENWAHWLKNQGIVIFSVNIDEKEAEGSEVLKRIASGPEYYVSTDYYSLTTVIQQMDICM